jgi:hypothetical protein
MAGDGIVRRGKCGLSVPALTISHSLHFSDANALASSSVKNVLLCRGERRAAALKSNFGSSNDTYQVLRASNGIDSSRSDERAPSPQKMSSARGTQLKV